MLKQQLNLKLSQKLSPQQIQLMKMIQLPTQAFEQRIAQELEENPALEGGKDEGENFDDEFSNDEFDDSYDEGNEVIETDINVDDYLSDDEVPSYKLSANNYSADDEERQMPYAAGTSFTQHLMQQLSTYRLDEEEKQIAEFLVGSVDESGYIRREIQDIVDDLAFTQNVYTTEDKVEKVLKVVQELDPAGVAARDLQECLLLQLERREQTPSVALAIDILDDSFDHFSKKHYKKLIQKFDITEDQLRDAIHEIEGLNPKPGGTYSGNNRIVEHVVPDFAIKIVDGELDLTLNGRNAPELHVSHDYTNMLKGYKESKDKSKAQKDAVMFIKQKLDAAKWFIDAIKQRQQTLYVTMNAIMHHQKEYFLSGDERKLKPMILKDIADKINMDVSTVSRVANSKYVDTPYGTKLIKEFFSESMKNDQGEDVSTKEIKKILEITISEEDKRKPLTDDKLAKILLEKGYPIARRTIAKYREQLDLPVARLRKEI
ncbi:MULTISPECIES: RNA polymerase factor sigma-54 [Aequorivita]|jgi:RNA polymerase sigma-54 factor|uniref:RNA polymerase sigma54 factor n=2 Tax=Aequorivita TaxID=153265 RepID=A0A137RJV1_9FLAO|nr:MULTISPECIES: RNA polymerase factor sigma-54 [Aequorivita]KJJ39709.1 RNA polymerase sigma54 factor [Aequorivita vladivostokensis]KXO00460.1 RNA polymerase sigma54 factor [Aequorivita aquimaris]HAV53711.1 RNA polymerase sigma-54 factor [Aequorivita sp.]